MWTSINNGLPPVGSCSNNLLLLWTKCPEGLPHPECYRGYELGFFSPYYRVFFNNTYSYRIDNVTHWMLLPTNPEIIERKE